MALLFEIRLSHQQISLLRTFAEWVDRGRQDHGPFGQFSHFVSHVKALQREKLVYHHELPKLPDGKYHSEKQSRESWGVTEKGRALLKVVDCELQEAAVTQQRLAPVTQKRLAEQARR